MVPHVLPHLRLLTLGAPLLISASNETVGYRTRKHFALLILLALEPGRRFAREYLIDLLWPDVPSERGRHSLSQAITELRQMVGRQHLATQHATVSLAADIVEPDVLRLESDAVEIRGRFLEGFEVGGAPGFEEWREAWAAQLQPRIRDYLVRRMDAARRIGDFALLERHARVLEQVDPVCEDWARGIMEARVWAGDRTNALKTYTRFAAQMSGDLHSKPGWDLERMAELMRQGRRAAPRPTADGMPARVERRYEAETIIGRQREFSILYAAWNEAQQRRPRVMVIVGDPGIGKTTLTNAFVSTCQMGGGIIARAQAYEAERDLPYAVLADLVRQLTLQRAIGAAEPEALADLSRLVPEVHTVYEGAPRPGEWPPEIVPLRLADAFFKAVAAAAEESPVVLVVDDIHGADNASVAILHMLARKLDGLRVLMILSRRHGILRAPSSTHALVTDSVIEGLETLELEALSEESAALLVASVSKKGIERWGEAPVDKIVRAGGGNPLALELLSREWVGGGGESLKGQSEALPLLPVGSPGIRKSIGEMVERQTEALSRRTRLVFELAAALGSRMGDLWLYQVIGCSETDALYELSQLLEIRLLRDVAGHLEFRNELIRMHAYDKIPHTLRLELHRRIAAVLKNSQGEIPQHDLEIAWHLILGRDRQCAIPFALSGAAQRLRSGAPREAELVLDEITHEMVDPENARRLHLLLSDALLGQSKADVALPHLEKLLSDERADKLQIAQAARFYASAMYLLNSNSTAKCGEMAERALKVAQECHDDELLAHALFECGRAAVENGNPELARQIREDVRATFLNRNGSPPPMAFHADAYCSYYLLDVADASESAKRAVACLSKGHNLAEQAQAHTGLGNCMMALARLEEARESYKLALHLSRKLGDDCRTSIVTSNIAASYLIEGKAELARDYAEQSLSIGRKAPAQPGFLRTWTNLAFAYVVLGELGKARDCFAAWQQWIQNGRSWPAQMEFWCDSAAMELTLGNTGEALELIAAAERAARGREELVVNQGAFERLRIFLTYHTKGAEAAKELAGYYLAKFKGRHILAEAEALAAVAWIEKVTDGRYSLDTLNQLNVFENCRILGKMDILIAQGFLDRELAPRSKRQCLTAD